MSRIFALGVLILLMLLLLRFPGGAATLSMSLGFLLLAGYGMGKIGNRLRLPGITGYIVAGILFGPHVFGMLNEGAVIDLNAISSIAVGLIALTAGGEVDLRRVRQRLKSYAFVAAGQVGVALAGVSGVMYLALWLLLPEWGLTERLVLASFFGLTAVTTSPAATVAVIVESGAKGRLSELILGITVLGDVVVLVLLALGIAAGTQALGLDAGGGGSLGLRFMIELGGSALAGAVLAALVGAYMRFVRVDLPLFILAVSFLSNEVANYLHLHGLLVCLCAGLLINNLSGRGREFIRAIEYGSLPVYVVFFGIAGAKINLDTLAGAWILVLTLVIARSFFFWIGITAGAAAAGEGRDGPQ